MANAENGQSVTVRGQMRVDQTIRATRCNLTPATRRVLTALATRSDHTTPISTTRVAHLAACTQRTAHTALHTLERVDLISITRRIVGGRRAPSIITTKISMPTTSTNTTSPQVTGIEIPHAHSSYPGKQPTPTRARTRGPHLPRHNQGRAHHTTQPDPRIPAIITAIPGLTAEQRVHLHTSPTTRRALTEIADETGARPTDIAWALDRCHPAPLRIARSVVGALLWRLKTGARDLLTTRMTALANHAATQAAARPTVTTPLPPAAAPINWRAALADTHPAPISSPRPHLPAHFRIPDLTRGDGNPDRSEARR